MTEEDISISDFFGRYPEIENPDFASYISRKEEFIEARASVKEELPPKGQLYKHQIFVVRYATWYDRLLVIHEPGTGKSCIIVALAEMYKKNFLEAPEDKTRINRCIILVRGPSLEQNIKDQIVYKCTDQIYNTTAIMQATNEVTTKAAITRELHKWYDIMTYGDFVKKIDSLGSQKSIDDYMNHKIIMCDEAHNLIKIRDVTGAGADTSEDQPEDIISEEDKRAYNVFHQAFHSGSGNKVMFFTATPMINSTAEFPLLMNLILDSSHQMPLWNEEQMRELQFETIEPYLRGKISYIRALDTGVVREYQGQSLEGYFIKVFPCEMSEFQYTAYIKESRQDKASSFSGGIRQISNFVYPDGSFGKIGYNRYYTNDVPKDDTNGTVLKNMYRDPEALEVLSTKAHTVLGICQNAYPSNPRNIRDDQGIIYVYFPDYVRGSGALDLAQVLEQNGYELYDRTSTVFSKLDTVTGLRTASITKRRRVAVLTSSTTSSQMYSIFDTLNSKENMYGEYIQVLIASRVGQEGININNAVAMIMYSSPWNSARLIQATDRVFRSTSHIERLKIIKAKMRGAGQNPDNASFKVRVYLLAAVYIGDPESETQELRETNTNTIDVSMFALTETKHREISHIFRFCKKADVGCHINYERNVRPGDTDGSPICDYQACNYTCAGIREDILKTIDRSTKILYYSEEEVKSAEKAIRVLFTVYHSIRYHIIVYLIKDIQEIYISMALEKMIRERTPILDSFGYYSYLQNLGNVFYLSKTGAGPENTVYDSVLIGSMNRDKNIFDDYVNNVSLQDIDYKEILSMDPETSTFLRTLAQLPLTAKVHIVESILYERSKSGKTNEIQDKIISIFSNSIYYIPEPVTMLRKVEDIVSNRNKGRGRKPKEANKYKVKKIKDTELKDIIYDTNTEPIIFHTLMNQSHSRTGYDTTSKYIKAEGKIRIYKPSEMSGWRDVNVYEHMVYNTIIQHMIKRIKDVYETYDIYGIMLPPKNEFRIRDKSKETEDIQDTKYSKKGKVCKSWKKDELIDIIYRSGIYMDDKILTGYTDDQIYTDLLSKGYNLKGYPSDRLRQFYILQNYTIDNLCDILQRDFSAKGKIFRGKIDTTSLNITGGSIEVSEDQTDLPNLESLTLSDSDDSYESDDDSDYEEI